MTRHSDFRKFSAMAGLILALIAPTLIPLPAEAQIRVTRAVDYDFIVDPQIVLLAKIEELRPDNVVVNAWLTIVPDKTIPNTDDGNQIIELLTGVADCMSRTFKNNTEYYAHSAACGGA